MQKEPPKIVFRVITSKKIYDAIIEAITGSPNGIVATIVGVIYLKE